MDDMRLYKYLGRAIAERRKKAGLKQEDLAKAIGLARASLANVENGRQRIMVHQLFLMVEALKLQSITDLVPATWHFDDEGEAPPLDMRLVEAKHAKADRNSSKVLTDQQQVVVQNLVRSALAPRRLGKRA